MYYIFFSIKSYRLTFFANAEYWKYFYCAFESFKGIEKYIFDKFENDPSSIASWKGIIPKNLSANRQLFYNIVFKALLAIRAWDLFVPPVNITWGRELILLFRRVFLNYFMMETNMKVITNLTLLMFWGCGINYMSNARKLWWSNWI